jgi:hypothetical protein
MRPNPRPYLAQAAECLEQAAGLAAEHGLLLFEVMALRDRGGGGRRSREHNGVLELWLGAALQRLRSPPAAFATVLGGGVDAALAMAGN